MQQERPSKDLEKSSARRPTELDVRIGQLLRQRRMLLGLRIEDLSKMLKVTPHQLQKYEVGENRIAASRLVDCARALDVPVVWFYQAAQQSTPGDAIRAESLAADEITLLSNYRKLEPEARQQLAGIAVLLGENKSKPMQQVRKSQS